MTCLVTAHSTKPGNEELYETFLKQRKLWFVRQLPGITKYEVYRTERRFPSGMGDEQPVRFNIMAVIEYDGSEDDLLALYSSPEWIAFMDEYMHLLEDDPVLYLAHEVREAE